MKRVAFWLILALLSLPLAAQSLTELSDKGKADREKNKSAKTYTNQDLKTAKGNVATSTLPQAKPAEETEPKQLTPEEEAEKAKKEKPNEYYHDMIVQKVRQIGNLKVQVDAADNRRVQARNDYMKNSSGPLQNRELKPQWDQAEADHKETRELWEKAKTELVALKEEARKHGVPAGIVAKAEEEGREMAFTDEQPPKK